jgi:hypothetical protein
MIVEWQEFDSEGFRTALKQYPNDVQIEDFTTTHKGEVIGTFGNTEPYFLINENGNVTKTLATDCQII